MLGQHQLRVHLQHQCQHLHLHLHQHQHLHCLRHVRQNQYSLLVQHHRHHHRPLLTSWPGLTHRLLQVCKRHHNMAHLVAYRCIWLHSFICTIGAICSWLLLDSHKRGHNVCKQDHNMAHRGLRYVACPALLDPLRRRAAACVIHRRVACTALACVLHGCQRCQRLVADPSDLFFHEIQ